MPAVRAAYRLAERHGRAAGPPLALAAAQLRQVWLETTLGAAGRASALLAEVERGPVGEDADVRAAIAVLRLRIAARRDDGAEVDRRIAALPRAGSTPSLIWAPDYALPLGVTGNWADIGFVIGPDGRVRDAEILRGSPGRAWTRPLIAQVRARRYTPAGPGTAPAYRIERFSLRATYGAPTGSHVRQKVGSVGLEVRDLTAAAPPS